MSFWDFLMRLFGGKGDDRDGGSGRGSDPGTPVPGRGGSTRRKMSNRGREFLTELEGFERTAYKDAAGLWTIGVGHLLTQDELTSGKIWINNTPVRYHNGLTDAQVDALLAQDLQRFEDVVNDSAQVGLKQHQFDALVSFSFNVGPNAFRNSTLLKELNKGNYEEIPNQLRRWVYAGGQVVQGLVNRREREARLWNGSYS